MNFGLRTPSLKKLISARTTRSAERTIKRHFLYEGKRNWMAQNPKKVAFNKVFNKTSFRWLDLFK